MARLNRETYEIKLDADFALAKATEGEAQSSFAKYICIRLSGYVEVCLKESIQNFVDGRGSHKVISKYIKDRLKTITNLDAKKLEQTLRLFCKDWGDDFKDKVSEEMKASLTTVYSNRNNIAHGGDSGITLRQLEQHYATIKNATRLIDEVIKRTRHYR